MLVMLVRRVVCRRYIVSYPSTRKCSLFNEDIRDETVDNRWACWRIRSRPQYDTGSGKYLKRVEHFENPEMWNALVEVSQLKAQSDRSESDKNADWGFSGLSERH